MREGRVRGGIRGSIHVHLQEKEEGGRGGGDEWWSKGVKGVGGG